ncbi:MAG TPA: YbhN family protein [Actinomycetes bacterium]|nr:YbhN family protein [Actinomycetes bacterium]
MRTQTSVPVRARKAAVLLLSAFVVIHFLAPQIAGVHRALYRLGQVKVLWLLLAVALEVASILAYTMLTRSVLVHSKPPRFDVLLRTQLSTLAVNHVVPGGAAAGGALGYRLLTEAGLSGTDAAFALATQSAGSAVVLNLLLWIGLVASIPLHGYNPLYGTAGVLGAVLIAGFAAVVVLLMRGEERALRALRATAARLPVLDPDRVVEITRRVADRLRTLVADRPLVGRAVGWAAANWLLDAASLWVFVGAFGHWVRFDDLIVAFALANVLAVLPITPSGLGVVEFVLTSTLVGFGTPRDIALLGVISYRVLNFWLPIPLGGLAYLSLRAERGARERGSEQLRQLAQQSLEEAEGARTWAVRHGMRVHHDSHDERPGE